MKSKPKELDVDFIGRQDPLTKEEEQKISEYLRNQKLKRNKKSARPKKENERERSFGITERHSCIQHFYRLFNIDPDC